MVRHKAPLGLAFCGYAAWAEVQRWNVLDGVSGYRGTRSNVVYSVPATCVGTPLAAVAAGRHDAAFADVARGLVLAGFPNAILRIGWEMNGDWFPWKARGAEAHFIAAYRRIADVMRAVPGTQFRLCWNPDAIMGRYWGAGLADPPDCYPGDAHVDYVGCDPYNRWWDAVNAPLNAAGQPVRAGETPFPIATQVVRWNREIIGRSGSDVYATRPAGDTTKPFGLAFFRRFATDHGKGLIIGEWGTGFDSAARGNNCGDDGYYTARMCAWMQANRVHSHCYWDQVTGTWHTRACFSQSITGVDPVRLGFSPLDNKPLTAAALRAAFAP